MYFNPRRKDRDESRFCNSKNQSVKIQRKKGFRLRFSVWRSYYKRSINYYSQPNSISIVTRYQYSLHNKYSEIQIKSLWIYVLYELSIFYTCNFFFIKLDTFKLLCKIIHSLSLAFILTILCRTPRRGKVGHVCKTLMRSINASAKRDRSIGPKILPFADAYRRDDVTPEGKTGQPHLARVAKDMLGQSMDPAVISAIINGVRLTRRRLPSLMPDKLASHAAFANN